MLDTGIDFIARTRGAEGYHAIQSKCFAPEHRVQKADIDRFFTASGRKPFTQRIIVVTTNDWSDNAEEALRDQLPPVSMVDLQDLENSQMDWAKYRPDATPLLKPRYPCVPTSISPKPMSSSASCPLPAANSSWPAGPERPSPASR